MIKISLKEYALLLGYEYQGEEDIFFNKIALDSRKIRPGDLFVAAKGETTNGHQYISQALEKGAVGLVSLGGEEIILEKTNTLIDKNRDTLEEFFYKTGKIIRERVKSKVIGVTGSAGKTTTKDMLYTVLKEEWNVIKTEGNFNNELGLPMTMSKANENTDYMILEMGMRGLDEIRYLSEISEPDYGIITSIEPVHAELLGSIENIAKAKAEIGDSIPSYGCLVINYKDEDILKPYLKNLKGKLITAGFSENADYYIKDIVSEKENYTEFILKTKNNERTIKINTPGKQNVQNAASVCALGDFINIRQESYLALMNVEFSEMRFNVQEISGVKIINDAYNANPAATCFSLESMIKVQGERKLFVFADMFELGHYEKIGHEQIATKALEVGVDFIFLLGNNIDYTYDKLKEIHYNMEHVFKFKEKDKLLKKIKEIIQKKDVILLKGSRGMHLEEIDRDIKEFLNVL